MSGPGRVGWRARAEGWRDRWQARRAAWGSGAPGPLEPPEPRLGGDPEAGRRLVAGRLRLGPEAVELAGRSPWDLAGEPGAVEALHAAAWLDDLAALGGRAARETAQAWAWGWIDRYGAGRGPGWTARATGGRLLRWTGHAALLLRGRDAAAAEALARSLGGQALFLARRLRALPPGAARIEPLAALVHAGLALPGHRDLAREAARGLGREAAAAVDATGAAASRSPEALLDLLDLLTGAARALTTADLLPDPGPAEAIAAAAARAAPVLRALRHADGGLARFHGGDRGGEGRLDATLAAVGRPGLSARGSGRAALAMGFARLAAGRTTVIADAALPPRGGDSVEAHASALALEVTVGRRPLVVACGPGRSFGAEWRRAGRATPSHSALVLERLSSSRLAPPRPGEPAGRLEAGPSRVVFEPTPLAAGLRVELAHDGWRASHGLTHARTLQLAPDGLRLDGEDLLTTLTAADGPRLDRALDRAEGLGLAVQVHFHLHPEVEAGEPEPLPGGAAVALRLPSGEEWALSHEGPGSLAVEPSAYLEEGAEAPLGSLQVVISARALGTATRLRWTLARVHGTPQGRRDLAPSGVPHGPAPSPEDDPGESPKEDR